SHRSTRSYRPPPEPAPPAPAPPAARSCIHDRTPTPRRPASPAADHCAQCTNGKTGTPHAAHESRTANPNHEAQTRYTTVLPPDAPDPPPQEAQAHPATGSAPLRKNPTEKPAPRPATRWLLGVRVRVPAPGPSRNRQHTAATRYRP